MSGTSIDGLDFSLIKSDGIKNVEIIQINIINFQKIEINNDLVEFF